MDILVRKARRGDQEAFLQLMEMHKQMMERVAFGFFRSQEDVADAIQETILDAFEHICDLRKTKYFRTWLTRILINNCNRIYSGF